MIKIDDKYELERDIYCWHLTELKPRENQKGEKIITRKTTYYSNLKLACEAIMDRGAGNCKTLEEIRDLYKKGMPGFFCKECKQE